MSILVLGTVALDTVKTPSGLKKDLLGGSAVHFSMSARLFSPVHLVAIVGEDFPRRHLAFLRAKGIILDSLIRSPGKTFKWEGEYKGDLNCAFTKNTELGVLLDFCPRVSSREAKIRNIFLANVDPEIQSRLLDCLKRPRLVGLDSMNYWIHNKRKSLLGVLKRTHIYVANDQEARDLSGEYNLIRAAKALSRLGPAMVLIKKGEHGAFFYSPAFMAALPAYPTDKVVDPTGAGDTFAGGLIGYLSRVKKINRQSIKEALACATIAASFNVEDFGASRTARLCPADLRKRLGEFKKMVLF